MELKNSPFGSCQDCEMISTQVLDVYHDLKCFELRLFWKLETLGKVMKLADKVPSREGFLKEFVENHDNETNSNSDAFISQIKTLRSFRTKIIRQSE